MPNLDPQAEQLNQMIRQQNSFVYQSLSQQGRAIFFPQKGLVAQGLEAKNSDINATIGVAYRDDKIPVHLDSIASQVLLDPAKVFPYCSSYGNVQLREKWQQMIYKKNPSLPRDSISLPLVTHALTHGLSMSGYLFIEKEDRIILPDLFWGNYKLVFAHNYGARLSFYPFFKGNGLNIQGLLDKINESKAEKKVILFNFPNNPSGYSPTFAEIDTIKKEFIQSANRGNQLVIIFDDAYFGLVYRSGVYRESLFAQLASAHENILAIKVDGATKEDYVWGFRVGFVTYGIKNGTKELYQALELKTAGAVRSTISNVSNLSQSLLLHAYNSSDYEKEKEAQFQLLRKRFNTVGNVLEANRHYEEYFTPLPYNSGYFMCIRLREGLDAETIRQKLLQQYSTGVIAIGNLIRIAYASTPTAKIPDLFENIYKVCQQS